MAVQPMIFGVLIPFLGGSGSGLGLGSGSGLGSGLGFGPGWGFGLFCSAMRLRMFLMRSSTAWRFLALGDITR